MCTWETGRDRELMSRPIRLIRFRLFGCLQLDKTHGSTRLKDL